MKSFFRVINVILFALALIAVAFCGFLYYSVSHYPVDRYLQQIDEYHEMTEMLKADTQTELEATQEKLDYLSADLRNNGPEAVALADRLDERRASLTEKLAELDSMNKEIALLEDLPGSVSAARALYGQKIRELEDRILSGESDVRICYWTLDDGPTYITENFLNAIDEMGEHVHITFFTANGANDSPNEEEMLRREMMSGHSVQNHTYSHNYWQGGLVYRSPESFREQIVLQDDWLYEVTGFHPGIFRFPGGARWGSDLIGESLDIIAELGYEWADWNCNLYDAGSDLPTSALELQRALTQVNQEKIAVVLGHDWNMQTMIAMKSAIPQLQEQGYVFLPLWPESVMMGQYATR